MTDTPTLSQRLRQSAEAFITLGQIDRHYTLPGLVALFNEAADRIDALESVAVISTTSGEGDD